MLVHGAGEPGAARLLRRRARCRRDAQSRRARPDPGSTSRATSSQVFHIGAASCRRPRDARRPRGGIAALRHACRSPSSPRPRPALARDGRCPQRRAGLLHRDPGADPDPLSPRRAASTRPAAAAARGRHLPLRRARRRARAPRRATAPTPFYAGDIGAALSDWVLERGGTLGRDDLAAYEPIVREPVRAQLRGPRDPLEPAARRRAAS